MAKRGSASAKNVRSAKTATSIKHGGYSSSGKPVSKLKPPPSGSGAGAKPK